MTAVRRQSFREIVYYYQLERGAALGHKRGRKIIIITLVVLFVLAAIVLSAYLAE